MPPQCAELVKKHHKGSCPVVWTAVVHKRPTQEEFESLQLLDPHPTNLVAKARMLKPLACLPKARAKENKLRARGEETLLKLQLSQPSRKTRRRTVIPIRTKPPKGMIMIQRKTTTTLRALTLRNLSFADPKKKLPKLCSMNGFLPS